MTETTSPDCPRDPILRVVPRPADINAHGHIFGGWVLSQMDIAGGIVAGREAQGAVATVAIETMEFIAPSRCATSSRSMRISSGAGAPRWASDSRSLQIGTTHVITPVTTENNI